MKLQRDSIGNHMYENRVKSNKNISKIPAL